MFQIVKDRTFRKKVSFAMPNGEGKSNKCAFTAIFKLVKVSEWGNGEQPQTNVDIARRVMTGFEDVVDGDGKPVTWSEEARDALLDEAIVANAVVNAYYEAVNEGNQARKN